MANYTAHYHLHQWEPEDSFLREDFNQDLARIDTALAKKTELVMGSYTGDGGTQQIDLGFAARVVLVGHPTHTVIAFQGETVNRITVNETGFQVVYSENATVGINRSGTVYHYLAIP